ncbi:alpha-amylase family glycosyl hydrolase [Orenia marismortui]|uniref:alpha-amylase family glycosyl hydrolase n=1 Tax=Orenia marismortui TaxID=46469 RepID=UPI00035D9C12|nr:alpha-amylase family glycosyl hydrolase [Orenia marismortui]
MRTKVRIHYDNGHNFENPVLWIWQNAKRNIEQEVKASGRDSYGFYYDLMLKNSTFNFKFKDQKAEDVIWEKEQSNRFYNPALGGEVWSKAGWHNIYRVKPAEAIGHITEVYEEIKDLIPQENFYLPTTDVSEFQIPSLLGAHKLLDGSISFAFFHPRAAQVSLASNLNGFYRPVDYSRLEDNDKLIPLKLYRGYYNQPNIWWAIILAEDIDNSLEQIEYKFYVQGGTAGNERQVYDPYTRVYSDELKRCVVVDPTSFKWTDQKWRTPDISELIIYELNVYGFTDRDSDIPEDEQSTFQGVIRRIKAGYFNDLGVTALALMPTSEAWTYFGLGYDPCSFMSVEKDFGTPDEFRELVNTAHQHGLAVIIDQVFNHTSNKFNPLWNLIDDGSDRGGLYFAGSTQWGNRLATGKDEVDNMLIDSCKLFIKEYHVDGFRFDATSSNYTDHKLLYEIQDEIRNSGFKSDAILIAENLPNESDLNFQGYNGYAQWSDIFHDKIKALLREGIFRNWCDNSPEGLGDIFYFSKGHFAAHTNNVINYSESHDETSVKFEVESNNILECDIKERKSRLAMIATMVALGQPMIYMGQELGVRRDRNNIDINKITPDPNCPGYEYNDFYHWTQKLINLRKKYSALKITGYNPIESGQFNWVIGPWLSSEAGRNKRVIGWKTKDDQDEMLILLNFEREEVKVDLNIAYSGLWFKLADIEGVYSEDGGNEYNNLEIKDKQSNEFLLPPYSGFIYKRI